MNQEAATERFVDARRARLVVTLRDGAEAWTAIVLSVGFEGVLVRCERRPATGKLITLEVTLPDDGARLTSLAAAEHIQTGILGPNLALRWYAQSAAQAATWASLVRHLRARRVDPRADDDAPANDVDDVARRRNPRVKRTLVVESVSGLTLPLRCTTENVSMKGMFLATEARLEPGARFLANVTDPDRGFRWRVTMVVRRRYDSPTLRGLGVEVLNPMRLPVTVPPPPTVLERVVAKPPAAATPATPATPAPPTPPATPTPPTPPATPTPPAPPAPPAPQAPLAANEPTPPVAPASAPSSVSCIEVCLRDGKRIRVPADFDPVALGRLLAAIEGTPRNDG